MCNQRCIDCRYYLQHHTFNSQKIFRVYCGHCTFSKSRRKQPDAAALFESPFDDQKCRYPNGYLHFWQRMRDSNPRKRSQSPVCYRYTNPLNGTISIIHTFRKMSIPFFKIFKIIFPRGRACRRGLLPSDIGMSSPLPHPGAW